MEACHFLNPAHPLVSGTSHWYWFQIGKCSTVLAVGAGIVTLAIFISPPVCPGDYSIWNEILFQRAVKLSIIYRR